MNRQNIGAIYQGGQQCSFTVWAPNAAKVSLHLRGPRERIETMVTSGDGYFRAIIEGVTPGTAYTYKLGDQDRPDPASRFQPLGVHGPSEVVDFNFAWHDQGWFGIPLRDYIIYELHVGTFTEEGTFDAVISLLAELKELGVTALELMPIAQFPGERNWGYDGVFPFAAQNSYGGPDGLRRLVDAAHNHGLAVVLDAVYNHLGPEGNYFSDFGPYFTDCYKTAWGRALNFDGEQSDDVRAFFLENALYWQTQCHIDALRLDAVHAIRDFSATPFLQELGRATRARAEKLNRRFYLIAESDLNDARYITPEALNGLGLDAQWSDDFHHVLHVLLTGESEGYYKDFSGVSMMAKVFRDGYAYTGQYSRRRKRRHGNTTAAVAARQFVVYSQNHDQVGNRMLGERLSALAEPSALKLAAACVLLSPFTPLLFMGEEYGEPAPFQYFISHTDAELVEAVRTGRKEEFSAFTWQGQIPDPQHEHTFRTCVLDRKLLQEKQTHGALWRWYRHLIELRKTLPALIRAERQEITAQPLEPEQALLVRFEHAEQHLLAIFCFKKEPVGAAIDLKAGSWRKILDSADVEWGGPGSAVPPQLRSRGRIELGLNPLSVLLFTNSQEI